MSIKSKGTVLHKEIASVFTLVPGVTDLTVDAADVETYDDTELAQSAAGRGKSPTGYADGGTVSGNLHFDPVDTTVQALTDDITTPAKSDWKVIWSDAANTEWPFTGIFKGLGVGADMSNPLLSPFSIEVDGLIAYPT